MTGSRPWDPDDPWDPDRLTPLWDERHRDDLPVSHACATTAHHECNLDPCGCGCHAQEDDDDEPE